MSKPPTGGVRLTPQQEAAVLSLESGVAVSAGAGCGKTKVLTERFLHELTGPARKSVRQIIALTFTDKAARELRDRVRQRCRALVLEGDEDQRGSWRTLRRALEAAPIGTFHSFCLELLRRFPIESGVEPGTTVLVPTITATLIEQSVDRSLRGWLGKADPGFVKLAVRHGTTGLRDLVTTLIEKRTVCELETWSDLSDDEILRRWRETWEQEVEADLSRQFQSRVIGVMELLSEHKSSSRPRQAKNDGLLDLLPVVLGDDEPVSEFSRIKELLKLTGSNVRQWPSPEVYAQVKRNFDALKAAMKGMEESTSWDEAVSREQAGLARELARLGLEAIDGFDRQKRMASLLDFSDQLLLARRLLRNPTQEVRSWVNRSAQLVLVDEFQDTDPIQDEIIQLLQSCGVVDSRLFLVGDEKQSIYRFRGAQPRLFQDRQRSLTAEGRKVLSQNFRSVPEILDFVNYLFNETFPGEEHTLVAGPGTPSYQGEARVLFVWPNEPQPAGVSDDLAQAARKKPKTTADEGRQIEARWLAKLIAQRLETGSWSVRDRETGHYRPARAGDVVFLLRTLKDSAPYESELARQGLDFHVQGASAFFGQQEVLDVINALAAIEDPYDSLALAAVMRSPFGAISDDGLFWLGTQEAGGLCRGFERWEATKELSEADHQAVGRLNRLLRGWRALKDRLPIARLLNRVLDETGYEPALLGEFLGDRRRANVRKLVRLARQFDEQGGLTLADFVARLRAYADDPPREDEAATSEEEGDSVRLMTIHQAKGLEFPIVVLPDLDRGRVTRSEAVAVHDRLGVVLKAGCRGDEQSGGKSLAEVTFKHLEDCEGDAELNRLLYVATTRAQDHLVLSCHRDSSSTPSSLAMKLLAERFDLEDGSPLSSVSPGQRLPLVAVLGSEPEAQVRKSDIKAWVSEERREQVARLIERAALAPSHEATETQIARDTPTQDSGCRWLSLDPARELDPRAARVEELVRALLADPELPLSASQLFARAQVLSRKMSPMASSSILREAVACVEAWSTSAVCRLIQESQACHRSMRWLVPWNQKGKPACVVEGSTEFLVERKGQAPFVVIITSVRDLPDWHEPLRLQLALSNARKNELEPASGFRIQLTPAPIIETEEACDSAAIDRLIELARRWT